MIVRKRREQNFMDDELKEMIKKLKMTPEEIKEYREKTKNIDKKLGHYRAYRTMMNETRRELLKFIGFEVRKLNDIKSQFNLQDDQILYHLSMLEQCFYIINSDLGWKTTPGGLAFMMNTQMGDKN